MFTIHQLGAGRLRVLAECDPIAGPPTVALAHPVTGNRLTLHAVPDGERAVLVAVITAAGTDIPTEPHFANSVATGFTVGFGLLRANRPAPGLGPADRIGLEAEQGKSAWRTRVLERLDGRLVQLEAHPPGCGCGRGLTISPPREPETTGVVR